MIIGSEAILAWDIILFGVLVYLSEAAIRRRDLFFSALLTAFAGLWFGVIVDRLSTILR